MKYKRKRYPLLLSKEDKQIYVSLAESMQKDSANLMYKLFEMYHSLLDSGGERLLRIRSSVNFGNNFSLDQSETVMISFLENDKEIFDKAVQSSGRSIKAYMIDLVKCGIFYSGQPEDSFHRTAGTADPPSNETSPPVKRKRGRPKGSSNKNKQETLAVNKPAGVSSDDPPVNPDGFRSAKVIPPEDNIPPNQPEGAEEQPSQDDDLTNDDIYNMLNNGDISVL